MTTNDSAKLKNDLQIATVVDLRGESDIDADWIDRLTATGFKHYNIPLAIHGFSKEDTLKILNQFTCIGQTYSFVARFEEYGKAIVEALKIFAESRNYPLVFHCSAGKDRTGILAAILLSTIGVVEEDVIHDYILSTSWINDHLARLRSSPNTAHTLDGLPDYMHESPPESMSLFLSEIRGSYGSVRAYLKAYGAESMLFPSLENVLLV